MSRPNRRRVLRVGGAALAAALAGCQDGSSNSTDEPSDGTANGTTNGTPMGTDDGSSEQNAADLEPVTVDEDWHMYQVDAQNTGFTENTMPSGEVEQRWQFEIDHLEGVESQPILADGTLYLIDGEGILRALDPSDGSEKWQAEREAPGVTPAYADGTVFINGPGGKWEAYDASTGERKWAGNNNGNVSLTVADGTLYGQKRGIVRAGDPETGENIWTATLSETGVSRGPVAVANGRVFMVVDAGVAPLVAGIDAASGDVLWQNEFPEGLGDAPTVGNGTVFVPHSNGTLYALDPETGEEQWTYQLGSKLEAEVNYHDGTVYAHAAYAMSAVDAASGEQQWQVESTSPYGILSSNGLLATAGGQVTYRDRATGERQWAAGPYASSYPVTTPVVANGLVFLGSEAGLTAYQAK